MIDRRHSLYYQRRVFNRVKTMRPPGDYLLRMYAETTGAKLVVSVGRVPLDSLRMVEGG